LVSTNILNILAYQNIRLFFFKLFYKKIPLCFKTAPLPLMIACGFKTCSPNILLATTLYTCKPAPDAIICTPQKGIVKHKGKCTC
jgi:hypothetical protein